jgi:hypothetical protein
MRERGWAILAFTAVIALLTGCAGGEGPVPPSATERSQYFGINAQWLVNFARSNDPDALNRQLDSLVSTGVGFVRANLNWGFARPGSSPDGPYDFSGYDRWVEALARHHLRWDLTLVGIPTPQWAAEPKALATCGERSPPGNPTQFAALAATVAKRYGRDGSFWAERPHQPYEPVIDYEIWNNPNYGYFWCPAPDPATYAATYAAAARAIKAVDAHARVLVGGLAGFRQNGPPTRQPSVPTEQFLRAMLASPSLTVADVGAVAVQLYGTDPAALESQLAWFRRIVDGSGLTDVPLVVDEIGWPTSGSGGPPPVDEGTRAEYLRDVTAAVARSDCGVIEYLPHTWITPEMNSADAEHWYGMADPTTADPYPTAQAYADEVAALHGHPAAHAGAICTS